MILLPAHPEPQELHLPGAWLGEWIDPQPAAAAQNLFELVEHALDQPVGAPRLGELLKPAQKIAIIVDDLTRHTPVRQVLPLVLDRLAETGAAREDICLVIALGGHRLMTPAEVESKIGPEICARYRVVQANCLDEASLVYLGQASNGIPAWVQRAVVEADLRIGLGMITPHMDAGFSGGAKIILPGVCGARTLDAFHARAADTLSNPLGDPAAPLRLVLEEFVQERVGLDFIVNLIMTPQGSAAGCVAGHPIAAHRQGVRLARQVYGAPVNRRYPVVVANCAPYQHDIWQSCKGLWCGDLLTASGGTLIWATQAVEGCQGYPSLPGYIGSDPAALKRRLDAGQLPDPAVAATGVMIARMKQRFQIVLVSAGLTAADANAMGLAHFLTVDEAIAAAVSRLPEPQRPGSVAVLPQAGITLPILST